MKSCLVAGLLLASTGVALADNHVIEQNGRRFHPDAMTIAKGDTLTVTNKDEFIHQIFVESPTFSFDTKEKAPGETDVETFTQAGTFEVRCHIHPKMKLVVTVK